MASFPFDDPPPDEDDSVPEAFDAPDADPLFIDSAAALSALDGIPEAVAPEVSEVASDDLAESEPELSIWARVWQAIAGLGLREVALRYASHVILLGVLLGAVWLRDLRVVDRLLSLPVLQFSPTATPEAAVASVPIATPSPTVLAPVAQFIPANSAKVEAIARQINVHTLIPYRGRSAVVTYTVKAGDTLSGIASSFGLKPETVLWSNYTALQDDPHLLLPGVVLAILPMDGVYHWVTPGNTLEQIAAFYGVAPQAITGWAGNRLDPVAPIPTPDTWLVIPGGSRAPQAWVVPTFGRSDRKLKTNDVGQCEGGYTGAVGAGAFTWPLARHTLGAYDYSSVHPAVDFRAAEGDDVFAVDGGIVVYAGENAYGYGNLVMIDHGNNWVSVYARLSEILTACGESVTLGQLIAKAGSTGNGDGSHLHFELRYGGTPINPWSVLTP